MLAVPCGCVKHFWGKDVKNAHTRMPEGNHTHIHTDRGREGGRGRQEWLSLLGSSTWQPVGQLAGSGGASPSAQCLMSNSTVKHFHDLKKKCNSILLWCLDVSCHIVVIFF